jgi:hypothetical protein
MIIAEEQIKSLSKFDESLYFGSSSGPRFGDILNILSQYGHKFILKSTGNYQRWKQHVIRPNGEIIIHISDMNEMDILIGMEYLLLKLVEYGD